MYVDWKFSCSIDHVEFFRENLNGFLAEKLFFVEYVCCLALFYSFNEYTHHMYSCHTSNFIYYLVLLQQHIQNNNFRM